MRKIERIYSNEKPFIKKFRTKKFYYVYDVNSNAIFRIDEIIFNIIDEFGKCDIKSIIDKHKHKYKISKIKKKYEIIRKAKIENNYFSDFRPEIAFEKIKSIDDIKEVLSSDLQHLILELTERCNQRCKYCGFSGRYKKMRTHRNLDMSFEIAKKALDFFINRSNKSKLKKPAIGFYGGEPLLKFDLIKQIVDYVKSVKMSKEYRFSLTTNGTLLNTKVVECFNENNIGATISLDGPKNIHDRYRVFSNGKETFNVILKNLSNIKKFFPGYFKKNISFNVVLAPPYDFENVITFFYKNPFFKEVNKTIIFNSVDTYETTFFMDFCLETYEKNGHKEMLKFRDQYKNALIKGDYKNLTIEKQFFDKPFYTIDSRKMKLLGKKHPPLGTCFPGQRRLFVNALGKFFMCEKVNSNYEIGNVDNGFDYEKIYKFFKKYEEFFKNCRYCWAVRLCKKCFNEIRKADDFDEERKNELCIQKLHGIEKDLIDYCEIREENIDAFKFFDEIIVL